MQTSTVATPSKIRTRTSKTSQGDCPEAQDPASILNAMLSKLLPRYVFKLLAVTPWSVRFEIEGVELFASNETNWKICLTDSQEHPSESLLCEHLNCLLTRDTQHGESAGTENSGADALVFNQPLSDEAYLRVQRCKRDTFRRAKNARRRHPKSEGYAGSLEA
jgi:hypothetical protein